MSVRKLKGFDLLKKRNELKVYKRKLPKIVANEALNHFLDGFRKGGGQTDAGRWERIKRTRKKDKDGRRRAILVDTGALRRDINVRSMNNKRIELGTISIDYGVYHNEGIGVPKREFLGDSKKLDRKIKKLLIKKLKEIIE